MLFYRLQSCNAQITMLQNHRILRGSKMPKSQTKPSNIQTVTFKVLVTSHHILVIVRCVLIMGNKRLMGNAFAKTATHFSVPHVLFLLGNSFVRIAIYFLLTHAMSFTNKCHLCQIIEFYKDQGYQSHIQSCQIYMRLFS